MGACSCRRSPSTAARRPSWRTTSRRPRAQGIEIHPFDDREVALTTWCSGVGALAAGRRWSLAGDAGAALIGPLQTLAVWLGAHGAAILGLLAL